MSHFSIFNSNWGGNGLICWAMSFPMCRAPCIKSQTGAAASAALEIISYATAQVQFKVAPSPNGVNNTRTLWNTSGLKSKVGTTADFLFLTKTEQYIPTSHVALRTSRTRTVTSRYTFLYAYSSIHQIYDGESIIGDTSGARGYTLSNKDHHN